MLNEAIVDVYNLQFIEPQNSEASDKASNSTVKIALLNIV
jgi:hypothetical protein